MSKVYFRPFKKVYIMHQISACRIRKTAYLPTGYVRLKPFKKEIEKSLHKPVCGSHDRRVLADVGHSL